MWLYWNDSQRFPHWHPRDSEVFQFQEFAQLLTVPINGLTVVETHPKLKSQDDDDIFCDITDFYPIINNYIFSSGQRLWSCETSNKLHSIERTVKAAKTYSLPRRDECIYYSSTSHRSYPFYSCIPLLEKEDPPECIACQVPLTVEHILLNCVDLMLIRHKYFTCTTLADLFTNVPSRTIVDFIKEIGL